MIVGVLIGVASGFLASWVVLWFIFWVRRLMGRPTPDTIRVFPDVCRLALALARDQTLPASVRWRLRAALLYGAQPFNLIPNFIPVIGLIDTVLVMRWALRSSVRIAGEEVVARLWCGRPDDLVSLYATLRIPPTVDPQET